MKKMNVLGYIYITKKIHNITSQNLYHNIFSMQKKNG